MQLLCVKYAVRKMLGIGIQFIFHKCALIMYKEPEMLNVRHKIAKNGG